MHIVTNVTETLFQYSKGRKSLGISKYFVYLTYVKMIKVSNKMWTFSSTIPPSIPKNLPHSHP